MSDSSGQTGPRFDPYYRWLGIPPDRQPPHHYLLLGLQTFEAQADVIESAADRQTTHVRTFASGKHAVLAAKILNEIAKARICLLKPDAKAEYDAALRAAEADQQPALVAVAVAAPPTVPPPQAQPAKKSPPQLPAINPAIAVDARSRKSVRPRTRRSGNLLWLGVVGFLVLVSVVSLYYLAQQRNDDRADAGANADTKNVAGDPQPNDTQPVSEEKTSDAAKPNASNTKTPVTKSNDGNAADKPGNLKPPVTQLAANAGREHPIVAPPPSTTVDEEANNSAVSNSDRQITEISGGYLIDMGQMDLPVHDIPGISELESQPGELVFEILGIEGIEAEIKGTGQLDPGDRAVLTIPDDEATVEVMVHFRPNHTVAVTATCGGPGVKPIELSYPRLIQTNNQNQEKLRELNAAISNGNAAGKTWQSNLSKAQKLSANDPTRAAAIANCNRQLSSIQARINTLVQSKARTLHMIKALVYMDGVVKRLNEKSLLYRVTVRSAGN